MKNRPFHERLTFAQGGRSAWFVGALLIFIYAVFALTLYVVPPAGQGTG